MMGSLDLSWAAEGQKKLFGESPAHSGLTCKGTRNQELQREDCSHGISLVNENTLQGALGICACRRLKG